MEDESRRWFSSMSERRWLLSRKNLRYSPQQIISLAVVVDSWLGGLISSLKKSKDIAPPNSLISLYSPSSFFSSLATPWLWSKRSVKSKLVRKTFVVSKGIKKEPKQVSGEILSFFTRKNFNVYSSWRNNYVRLIQKEHFDSSLLLDCETKGLKVQWFQGEDSSEERTSCSAHVLYM
ncbi:hypothetical protein F2Q69_00034080 [Brassica cretica]|uniref:Uncharacterized protein n=1 Tax=Brassica cretica TaxID=69181 RepID=A0A8S9SJI4_BRACR|nr:hypothetical protein F2Q69_00034080 [Brassica cretica]